MSISIDSEKTFDKTHYPFMTKILQKMETERKFPQPSRVHILKAYS